MTLAMISVQSLDLRADIFAVPSHKLVFSSVEPPVGLDLLSVKVQNKDLKCHIQPPDVSKKEEQQAEEDPDNILEVALQVAAQLKCLDWHLGFWKYQWCPNQYMIQLHTVPDKNVQLQYDLGSKFIQSELQIINDTHTFAFVSILQGSGTICDVTGEPRTTEVQIHCKQDVEDHISKVSEISTCKYLVVVYSSKLCKVSQKFIPKTVVQEQLIICYNSQIDGSVPSFFDQETQEKKEVKKEVYDHDSILAIAKKLLEQNLLSVEEFNLEDLNQNEWEE